MKPITIRWQLNPPPCVENYCNHTKRECADLSEYSQKVHVVLKQRWGAVMGSKWLKDEGYWDMSITFPSQEECTDFVLTWS